MKRIAIYLSTSFALGIFIAFFASEQSTAFEWLIWAVLFCGVLTAAFFWLRSERKTALMCVLIAALFAFGYWNTLYYVNRHQSRALPYQEGEHQVVARVEDVQTDRTEERVRLKLRTVSIDEEAVQIFVQVSLIDENREYFYGDILSMNAKLFQPSSLQNDHSFDYGQYMKAKGYWLSGYALAKNVTKLGNEVNGWSIKDWAGRTRDRIRAQAELYFSGDQKAIFLGILLGDKSELSNEVQTDFRDSGISHLVAVSGLHVNILMSLLMLLFYFGNRKSRVMHLISIGLILFVIFLTGAPASAMRAGMMLGLYHLGCIFSKESDSVNSLFVSGAVILFLNPFSVYDIGFQLSFLATLGILLLGVPAYEWLFSKFTVPGYGKHIIQIAAVTLSAQIMTLPILIDNFYTVSLLSVVTNLIIAPLVPILMGSAVFFLLLSGVSVGLGLMGAWVCGFCISLLEAVAHLIGGLPGAVLLIGKIGLPTVVLYYLGLFIVVRFLKQKRGLPEYFACGTAIVLLVWIASGAIFAVPHVTFSFLNVGQGDSCLITAENGAHVLVDGGGMDTYDIGEEVLLPFLEAEGIREIDFAMVSHYDFDHIDGILTLMQRGLIQKVYVPENAPGEEKEIFLMEAESANVPVLELGAGERIPVSEQLSITCLSPERQETFLTENDRSLVIEANCYQRTALFCGDITEQAESKLTERYPNLHADILKVAHHGSKTSSGQKFLDCIKPKYMIISVGKNYYGHPDEEVVRRLLATSGQLNITKENGTVNYEIYPNGLIREHHTVKGT